MCYQWTTFLSAPTIFIGVGVMFIGQKAGNTAVVLLQVENSHPSN